MTIETILAGIAIGGSLLLVITAIWRVKPMDDGRGPLDDDWDDDDFEDDEDAEVAAVRRSKLMRENKRLREYLGQAVHYMPPDGLRYDIERFLYDKAAKR